MSYGVGNTRRVDPAPAVPSLMDQSRINSPVRLEPRRIADASSTRVYSVLFTLDGRGSDFVPDTLGCDFTIPHPSTLARIRFWESGGALASIDFDLWLASFANLPPTIADTILPAPISVVGAASYEDEILDSVNRDFPEGYVLKLFVNSAALVVRGFVELRLIRSI